MTIDYQRIYHTGIRVADLDKAMAELGDTLSLVWAEVREVPQMPYWTPDDGMVSSPLRFVYSCQPPQHVELVEGGPGSIWDGREVPGVHHVGVWCDNVAAETEAAIADGWTCMAAGASPDNGYGRWSYVQPPTGMLVEFVSAEILPGFQKWWSDGLTAAMSPPTDADRERLTEQMRTAVAELRVEHREIARARMGLDADRPLTPEETAAAFGVSRAEVDDIAEELAWRLRRRSDGG